MPTVTVPRGDVTSEEVCKVLRNDLPASYNVLPGMAMSRPGFMSPHQGTPDTIVVGTGGNRWIKCQVTIVRRDGQTDLRISPGGLVSDLVMNTFGVARDVQRVLTDAPSLR
jgi:hypothetical protein